MNNIRSQQNGFILWSEDRATRTLCHGLLWHYHLAENRIKIKMGKVECQHGNDCPYLVGYSILHGGNPYLYGCSFYHNPLTTSLSDSLPHIDSSFMNALKEVYDTQAPLREREQFDDRIFYKPIQVSVPSRETFDTPSLSECYSVVPVVPMSPMKHLDALDDFKRLMDSVFA
jgi:hypothetical protein